MAKNKTFIYEPELYYFNNKVVALRKAVLISALSVGAKCKYYKARLIAPNKGVKIFTKEGMLPENQKEKEIFIKDLVNWIFDNTQVEMLFALFLDDEPLFQKNRIAKFDHHDDTDCWVLNLVKEEFNKLQSALEKEKLPKNLFYPANQQKCVDVEIFPNKTGLFWKMINVFLGWQKSYTPMEWENRDKNNFIERKI